MTPQESARQAMMGTAKSILSGKLGMVEKSYLVGVTGEATFSVVLSRRQARHIQ